MVVQGNTPSCFCNLFSRQCTAVHFLVYIPTTTSHILQTASHINYCFLDLTNPENEKEVCSQSTEEDHVSKLPLVLQGGVTVDDDLHQDLRGVIKNNNKVYQGDLPFWYVCLTLLGEPNACLVCQ